MPFTGPKHKSSAVCQYWKKAARRASCWRRWCRVISKCFVFEMQQFDLTFRIPATWWQQTADLTAVWHLKPKQTKQSEKEKYLTLMRPAFRRRPAPSLMPKMQFKYWFVTLCGRRSDNTLLLSALLVLLCHLDCLKRALLNVSISLMCSPVALKTCSRGKSCPHSKPSIYQHAGSGVTSVA